MATQSLEKLPTAALTLRQQLLGVTERSLYGFVLIRDEAALLKNRAPHMLPEILTETIVSMYQPLDAAGPARPDTPNVILAFRRADETVTIDSQFESATFLAFGELIANKVLQLLATEVLDQRPA